MNDINVGDTVAFIDDEKKQLLTVNFIHEDGCLEFVEVPFYTFPVSGVELVKKCPYQEGHAVELTGMFWRECDNDFIEKKVVGTVERNGWIEFDERTFDHFGISVTHLNRVRTGDDAGCDCDAAFCEPGDDNIRKAKMDFLRILSSKVEELKEEYEEKDAQLRAMREKIGQQ